MTLKPPEYPHQELDPSYALAAGGVISSADDLATWMRALVSGKILDADYQRQWLDSPEPEDPSKPLGQKYGCGIAQMLSQLRATAIEPKKAAKRQSRRGKPAT